MVGDRNSTRIVRSLDAKSCVSTIQKTSSSDREVNGGSSTGTRVLWDAINVTAMLIQIATTWGREESRRNSPAPIGQTEIMNLKAATLSLTILLPCF